MNCAMDYSDISSSHQNQIDANKKVIQFKIMHCSQAYEINLLADSIEKYFIRFVDLIGLPGFNLNL